jgi:hypothetical protein
MDVLAVSQSSVLFFNGDRLMRVPKTGGPVLDVADLSFWGSVSSVAARDEIAYVGLDNDYEGPVGSVIAVSLDGLEQRALAKDLASPQWIYPGSDAVYWVETSSTSRCFDTICSDDNGRVVRWTEATGAVSLAGPYYSVSGGAIVSEDVYFLGDGNLRRVGVDGGPEALVLDEFCCWSVVAIDAVAAYAFREDGLWRHSLEDGMAEHVLGTTRYAHAAAEDESLYIAAPDGLDAGRGYYGGSILRFSKQERDARLIAQADGPQGVATDDHCVYWIDRTGVWRAAKQ